MKRPLAIAGFAYFAALTAASFFEAAVAGALSVLLLVFAVIVWTAFSSRRLAAAALFTCAAAFAAFCLADVFWYRPAARLAGQKGEIYGTVIELPQHTGEYYYYILKTDRIRFENTAVNIRTKIRLRTGQAIDAQPFDKVAVAADLRIPASGAGFDGMRYYRSKGIYLAAYAEGGAKVEKASLRPPYYYAIRLRQYISGVLDRYIGGTWGALAGGILIGDVSGLPQSVKNDFTDTGISHLLAVSGTQTSLITQCLLLLLCALRLPKRAAAGVSAGAVALFMAVTGFSPSVMRAGLMSLIFLAGMMIGREADALNSLGLSVFILCLFNPYAASDTGLQLSFAATLGMITLSNGMLKAFERHIGRLPERLGRCLRWPAGLLCETTGASLLTYPIIALSFGQIALVTPLSNILEVPAALFVTLASAAVVLMAPLNILAFLIKPLAVLIRIAAAFMTAYARLLAGMPYATVSSRYGFVYLFILFAAAAVLLYRVFRGRGASLKVCAVCLCFTLACGMLSYAAANNGVLEISELPLASGSSTVICRGARAIVFDLCGSSAAYQAARFLRSRNIRAVDAVILPAYDQQRVDNVNSLLTQIGAEHIFIPGAYRSDENAAAQCVDSTARIEWEGVTMTLMPGKDAKTLIAKLTYGASSALLTGGAAADAAGYGADAQFLKADVLFFGSDIAKDFAQCVSPQIGVKGGMPQAAYAEAALSSAGCRVRGTQGERLVRLLTRGNGLYRFGFSF